MDCNIHKNYGALIDQNFCLNKKKEYLNEGHYYHNIYNQKTIPTIIVLEND